MRKVSIAYRAVTKESGDRVGVVTWGGLSRYSFPLADAISLYNHYFMELFWELREVTRTALQGTRYVRMSAALTITQLPCEVSGTAQTYSPFSFSFFLCL